MSVSFSFKVHLDPDEADYECYYREHAGESPGCSSECELDNVRLCWTSISNYEIIMPGYPIVRCGSVSYSISSSYFEQKTMRWVESVVSSVSARMRWHELACD